MQDGQTGHGFEWKGQKQVAYIGRLAMLQKWPYIRGRVSER